MIYRKFIFSSFLLKATPIVFLLLAQLSCTVYPELKQNRDVAEADLTVICKNIPVPETFKEGKSENIVDIKKVALFRRYKSNDSCRSSGDYFKNYFVEQGWNQDQMKAVQRSGGMRVTDFEFRNGEYVVSVECQNDVKDNNEKIVVISCSWGLK